MSGNFFVFYMFSHWGYLVSKKVVLKLWTSISRSNVGKKDNLSIPEVGQAHMMTHTKREPC